MTYLEWKFLLSVSRHDMICRQAKCQGKPVSKASKVMLSNVSDISFECSWTDGRGRDTIHSYNLLAATSPATGTSIRRRRYDHSWFKYGEGTSLLPRLFYFIPAHTHTVDAYFLGKGTPIKTPFFNEWENIYIVLWTVRILSIILNIIMGDIHPRWRIKRGKYCSQR